VWVQEVINSYASDDFSQSLLQELAIVSSNDKGYSLCQGLVRFKKKIWVGSNSAIHTKTINVFHSSVGGGHFGVHATYHRIGKHFWWQGIRRDVESFVQQCSICQ
jgi:hypothetical protein